MASCASSRFYRFSRRHLQWQRYSIARQPADPQARSLQEGKHALPLRSSLSDMQRLATRARLVAFERDLRLLSSLNSKSGI